MLRLVKILSLLLVLAAIGAFIMSCGNGGNAQVRVVNAIPNPAASSVGFDIYVNNDKLFPDVLFDAVNPSPTGAPPQPYVSVPSGSATVQAYQSSTTTTNLITGANTATFSGATQYTLVLAGYLTGSPSPSAYLISDNNTEPGDGELKIRIINASPYSANNGGGIAVEIYQNGQAPPPPVNVTYGQSSGYLSFPLVSGITYFVRVFLEGNATPRFTYSFTPGGTSTAGSITTLVFVDNSNGSGISTEPLYMPDLN
jgi:hypothetical protein